MAKFEKQMQTNTIQREEGKEEKISLSVKAYLVILFFVRH